jgi:hypothetical protein
LSKEKADIVTYDIVVTGELKDEILARVPGECFTVNGIITGIEKISTMDR